MLKKRITSCNRPLSDIESMQKQAYKLHRLRVKQATATVDMEPPNPRPHVLYNAKRLQLQRERQEVITKENFILLTNLRDIMCRSAKKDSNDLSKPKSDCIRIR